MLQLLNPIWLFGISGILIPLIIHLWNVKTGKTLKVGSVSLLGESSKQNSRSLKLMDLLLLFLRCMMIILLSTFLAEPVWINPGTSEKNAGWVLAEKENFVETYSRFKPTIDSLISSGNELHLFEPGFKVAELEDLLQDTMKGESSKKIPYWSLVKLLEQEIPRGSKAFIFSSDRLNRFKGERPSISTAIKWKTYSPADSTSKWIRHAYLSSSGSIRSIISESSPKGTSHRLTESDPAQSNSELMLDINNGKPSVRFKDGYQQTGIVSVDTATLKIMIYNDRLPADAEYVSAAIDAIQKYTLRKIKLLKLASGEIPGDLDFLFWLSPKDLPAAQLAKMKPGSSVFLYANGKATLVNSWIDRSAGHSALRGGQSGLYKRIAFPEDGRGFPVWEDGFGKSVLDMTVYNKVSVYRFYSRLDPEWTELVWSPDLVKLLMPMIIPVQDLVRYEVLDRRSIAELQILPLAAERFINPKEVKHTDVKYYFWLLLLIIFFAERWLSFNNNKI